MGFLGHGWHLLHGGLLRWRLETFGLYMPSYPLQRPWWRVNRQALLIVLRQIPGYLIWLRDMHHLGRGPARLWWRNHLEPADYRHWQRALARLNAVDGER